MCRVVLGLEGDVDRVALGEELVQPEREDRTPVDRVADREPSPAGLPRSARAQSSTSTPVSSASSSAACGTVVGVRRIKRPVLSSTSSPKVVSTQPASGSATKCRVVHQELALRLVGVDCGARAHPGSSCASGVARTRVSPMTRSGVTSVPNSRVATSATTLAAPRCVPSLDIVALVPMT